MAEENLSAGVLISVVLHVALLAVFSIKSVLFPTEPIRIEEAIRVDLVGLPDKIQKKPPPITKKAPPAPKPKPKVAKPKKINLNKVRNKQSNALAKLKAQAALDRLKKQPSPAPASPKKIEYRGNVLSAGTELRGISKLQHQQYLTSLKRHIHNNWFLPEWLTEKEFSAELVLKMNERGELISVAFLKQSGNIEYDKLAESAIKKSSPFPKPPEKFKEILRVDGIGLGFP